MKRKQEQTNHQQDWSHALWTERDCAIAARNVSVRESQLGQSRKTPDAEPQKTRQFEKNFVSWGRNSLAGARLSG